MPSMSTLPEEGAIRPVIRLNNVVFPEPFVPVKTVVDPGLRITEKSLKTGFTCVGYFWIKF